MSSKGMVSDYTLIKSAITCIDKKDFWYTNGCTYNSRTGGRTSK